MERACGLSSVLTTGHIFDPRCSLPSLRRGSASEWSSHTCWVELHSCPISCNVMASPTQKRSTRPKQLESCKVASKVLG
eukprot:6119092-Amphidinium_carterae.1